MVGRNDECSCGSGKKHKKCCGGPVNTNNKQLSPKGMQRAFLYTVACMCEKEGVDCLTVSCKSLDTLHEDLRLAVGYDPKKDAFIFKPVKVEPKPLIVTPDKRIIV